MPHETISVSGSYPLNKALALGNSTAGTFYPLLPSRSMPSGDGVYDAGLAGMYSPRQVLLLPYADGSVGSSFSLRLYGWRNVGPDPNTWVWVPMLLVELSCTTCIAAGPVPPFGTLSVASILDSERFCDTLAVVNGSVGPGEAELVQQPGTDLIGFAVVYLRGCQRFQFDFQQTDPVGMNCLWARG